MTLVVSFMPDIPLQPVCFQGVEPRTWTPNRLYRVFVLPSELILIRAGSTGEITTAVGMHFGLIGGLIAAAANHAKKNQKQQEETNNSSPNELLKDHKHNFRVPMEDLEAACLDPSSFKIAALYHLHNHAGVLRFECLSRGSVTIAISSTEEMKKAFDILPAVFGARLTINVEWSEKKKRFVGRRG